MAAGEHPHWQHVYMLRLPLLQEQNTNVWEYIRRGRDPTTVGELLRSVLCRWLAGRRPAGERGSRRCPQPDLCTLQAITVLRLLPPAFAVSLVGTAALPT